jgi:hypothetical protein
LCGYREPRVIGHERIGANGDSRREVDGIERSEIIGSDLACSRHDRMFERKLGNPGDGVLRSRSDVESTDSTQGAPHLHPRERGAVNRSPAEFASRISRVTAADWGSTTTRFSSALVSR